MEKYIKKQTLLLQDNNLFNLLKSMYNNVVVLDNKGVILWVSPCFEESYSIRKEEILGKTTYEVANKGIFYPSVAAQVIKSKQKTTVLEKNKKGKSLIATGIPTFNNNKELELIISYTFDPDEFFILKNEYDKMEKLVDQYSSEIRELREKDLNFPGIISKSKSMQKVLNYALKVALVDTNVIITGESGVGKNLIAQLIHQKSIRDKEPFIEINCGAIPENLIESELFGYVPGAFTGAQQKGKIGLIELAHKGTLFLDEIGELPLALQVKLLKVLQDKTLTKIGDTKSIKVDFRLITATNKDLNELINKGQFREDLYYRINVVPIHIPPLRERKEDILPLILHFLEQLNIKYNRNKYFSSQAINELLSYDFPGNVRQLQNVIERCIVTSDGEVITTETLPENITVSFLDKISISLNLPEAIELLEKNMVQKAYEEFKTTIGVAEALGISQPTAVRKIKKYIK
ncbi:Transcriptional regulator containing PAS, AAA-type ATPase, and DNA-binding Fis domains [Desulfonispora thiosulfatigenes DSM 11270]|uniref:HTH-type transcriptional regulatory protein TyrR n=1 Tax=Desulfonispora thiosulfatigenes DSM 11270 TaxID=656914 RepID=A0A1W1VBS0_DESTI|nr:sigma 54-interacting transcriptional regulator [Desulfonispora thiosulfatigenes]SMB90640.1 Transcriptional regulator containing PAS, AAA-type ATPase, and DNA-binding Fis domains [Desulfonispora thiosulfatigenes DSM 11270]